MAPISFNSICSVSHPFVSLITSWPSAELWSPPVWGFGLCSWTFVCFTFSQIYWEETAAFLLPFLQWTKFKGPYQCFCMFFTLPTCCWKTLNEFWIMTPDQFIILTWHVFSHQYLSARQWLNSCSKISLEGQTCCTVLYYDNVSSLTFHANEAWMKSISFQSLGWKDTVISQVNRAGRGRAQAIKKVTAHPAQWQAEASHSHTNTCMFIKTQVHAHDQRPCND